MRLAAGGNEANEVSRLVVIRAPLDVQKTKAYLQVIAMDSVDLIRNSSATLAPRNADHEMNHIRKVAEIQNPDMNANLLPQIAAITMAPHQEIVTGGL